ncbi:DEAD/DEAH box helicase [Nitrosomonas sp.]|uniref:DEAD/DEAH box helicase family protein n=1 Tax=Nitrosomonas sp. TaxID=42353 RepID=UPI0025E67E57|nr:DEAD/DEAH box helicase [Nitrosomonas sp.]MCC6917245.1 hypothetical protein [Nitrosomonas sp.]
MIEQENIVRYWYAVELLQPQSAPKLKKRSNSYSAFIHDTPIRHPVLPWASESVVSKQVLPKKRVWSHTLYAHLYDSRLVAEKLKEAYGADQGYREPQFRESALFAAKFTMAGQMVDNSFVLSSEAWFLGRVLTGKDWTRGFEDDQKAAGDQAKTLLAGQVSGDSLRELTQWILQFLGVADFFGHMDRHQFRFRSQPVKPDKPESEDNPLNSFLLDDLADVADSISQGVKSDPLDQYLRQYDPQQRLHVDDDRASLPLIDRLMPDAYANSCWPSERHLGLVHSQQLAVNTILATPGNGQGLLGINGPPGTGKTTLLRDLIATIIASRADALAKLRRASDGFANNGREEASDGGKPQACFRLNPALYGFEIVVASSNNGAVENVTLELPQRDKIDESWLPDAEYFADLGELTSGKPAWGLISGALGSKARRKNFVDCYFFGQRPFGGKDKADSEAEEDADVESDEEIENTVDTQSSDLSALETLEESDGGNDDHDNASPEKDKGPQGFWGWLNTHAEINAARSSEQRQAHWLPNRQSAQTLADEATPWGRMAGPIGSKTWVGLPLVVHRRCDRPMHELANRIAYDGAMVYGTIAPDPEKETRASLLTGWIHANGTSQGNWVPAEGKVLQELLALLREDGVEAKDISVITPFTDVRNNLKRIVGKKMVFGTIHTMQGKQAPVVILVLGGNTAGSGARNWAVSEPNLLNVAATRAKRRFYVVGDRNDWKNRSLFCDVMDLLPLQKIPAREREQMSLPQ